MSTRPVPDGWKVQPLGEICEKPDYGWTTKASAAGTVKFLRTTDISKPQLDWGTVPFCDAAPPEGGRFRVAPGDIVISRAGSVGLSKLIGNCPDAAFASYLIRFRPKATVNRKYLSYFLQSPSYWDEIASKAAGIALQNVNAKKLSTILVPLAPREQQDRIVAEIEKQFTRLDVGVEALKRLQAHLRSYRAAVLKAACEGTLVANEAELARREGRDYEPASTLLLRAAEERSAYWAQEGRGRRVPLETSLPQGLSRLPEGWAWATFDQLSCRVTVGHVGPMKDEYVAEGVPFLRSQNVRENRFDPVGLLRISGAFHEKLSKSLLKPGDLCIVRSGSVGTTCVLPESVGEANCADLVLVQRPLGVLPKFAAYYMNSLAKARVRAGQVGIALTHFNTKSVAALPVPVPPLAEQTRIVDRTEAALSEIDAAEASVASCLGRADRLRRAVLHAAFEGRLTLATGTRSSNEVA